MNFRKPFFEKKTQKKIAKMMKESKETSKAPLNEQALRTLFELCSDVIFSSLQFHQYHVTLVYCRGMINNDMLYKTVPLHLDALFQQNPKKITAEFIQTLKLPGIRPIHILEEAADEIFSGNLLLIMESEQIYTVETCERPERNPEEGNMEISIKGPRDNFIENAYVNFALIRKRLKTASLLSEQFEIGKRTKTKVILLYIKDLANPDNLGQIKNRLNEIDIDGLYNGTQLEGLLNDRPFAIFPRHTYTARADFVVQSLLSGRFVFLMDGVPYAFITPVNLFLLLKAAEDNETNYFYNSFERLIRVFGLAVSAFLPGFWVAITSFHQNQLPFTLLATVVESRKGIPFPTALEALMMLLLFEVFKEAGMRLPLSIGQTLSVIGGLIIGDAAIRAGLTNPAMLVIIAASTIATFTLVNQSLVGVVSLLRFFVIILSATLGFFGFFVSVFIIGIYVAKIHTFEVPYLQIAKRLSFRNAWKAIAKEPVQIDDTRPSDTKSADPTKQGGST